jgi:hypothetical protein
MSALSPSNWKLSCVESPTLNPFCFLLLANLFQAARRVFAAGLNSIIILPAEISMFVRPYSQVRSKSLDLANRVYLHSSSFRDFGWYVAPVLIAAPHSFASCVMSLNSFFSS